MGLLTVFFNSFEKTYKDILKFIILPFIVFTLLINLISVILLQYIIASISIIIFSITTPILLNKIKLKPNYTKRVNRFLLFFFTMYVLSFFYCFHFILIYKICYTAFVFILPIFIFIIFCVANIFSKIVEYIISKYYILKAKIKLKKLSNLIVIGVTGSYGKTSVKNILYDILSTKYSVLKTPQSYNTPMGIAKTINNDLKSHHKIFICEMGATKVGDINYLCKFVKPQIGIITSIGKQHLKTFKNVNNIIKTKLELLKYLTATNGFVLLNLENKYLHNVFDKVLVKKSGVIIDNYNNISNLYNAKIINVNKNGSEFEISYNSEKFLNVSTKLLGMHNIINILQGVAISVYLGLSKREIEEGISKIKQIPHRMEIKKLPNNKVIIDNAFNSNVDTIKYSIDVLKLFDAKHKIIITPGLVELSSEQYTENYLFGRLISSVADEIVIIKETNKRAITNALIDNNFNMENVRYYKKFDNSVYSYINDLPENSVILIENDLPENYV